MVLLRICYGVVQEVVKRAIMDSVSAGSLLFYLGGTVGFILVASLLVIGARWHQRRIRSREISWLTRFEKLVAFGMFIGAGFLVCMILLVISSILSIRITPYHTALLPEF